ncbi:hypothetical protein [Acinetobacter pittii]|uniref:hypothetical protein n=1 Tax=Acinetobacter pittii TaxID=48296 RepID=UPI000AC7BF72|nr:hypothetical protein [Acinetobacter pittii]MDP7847048.1 hypothetical protein [Acinetobacter pittii]MDP7869760.1 hypothetical protein [Acinetobacter pittii]UFN52629.1 hypothetical protein LPS07_13775 [Acinetobacter pittii]SSV84445.1 Uncharacterised protein [Acinetobacter pittii]
MIDLNKKREAFERFHAKECNCSYENLKRQLDKQEALTGHRYLPTSPRHEAWLIWDAAWNAANAQAVPESFEVGRLKDRITELLDERQDLYAQINSAPDVTNNHVVIPKECPDPIFADSLFNYLRSKSYTEEKGFEYIYLSDIDETEVWNFVVKASESGAEQ